MKWVQLFLAHLKLLYGRKHVEKCHLSWTKPGQFCAFPADFSPSCASIGSWASHFPTKCLTIFILQFPLLSGNGCPLFLVIQWMLSSHRRNPKWKKRVQQINWLLGKTKLDEYRSRWFYYDIYNSRYQYINGCARCTKCLFWVHNY